MRCFAPNAMFSYFGYVGCKKSSQLFSFFLFVLLIFMHYIIYIYFLCSILFNSVQFILFPSVIHSISFNLFSFAFVCCDFGLVWLYLFLFVFILFVLFYSILFYSLCIYFILQSISNMCFYFDSIKSIFFFLNYKSDHFVRGPQASCCALADIGAGRPRIYWCSNILRITIPDDSLSRGMCLWVQTEGECEGTIS
jgi:hypothetical protein